MAQTVNLTEMVQTAGDLPKEGMFNLLSRIAYKTREGAIKLTQSPDLPPLVVKLYSRFTDNTRGISQDKLKEHSPHFLLWLVIAQTRCGHMIN